MASRILNTNMGLGFQRGRKYDTDLDRLGRMETAQSELRKTGDLNLQGELKKLKKSMGRTYSVKRFSVIRQRQREFGMMGEVGDAVRDAAGNTLKMGGKLLDNGVTKTAAGIAGIGAMGTGANIGAAAGSIFGPAGTVIGGALGALATPFVAAKGVGMAGKALKDVGNAVHS